VKLFVRLQTERSGLRVGEPSIKPSFVYIYTILGLSDLFAILNLSALSAWELKEAEPLLNGDSIFEISLNCSNKSPITLSILVDLLLVLYLLLIISAISKNKLLPSVK